MRPHNDKRMVFWISTVLVLSLVCVTGCVQIEVTDTTPTAGTPDPSTSPPSTRDGRHNLAVQAVDFDPPLSYQQLIMRRQSVALLVAIENTGNSTERNVAVHAQLSSPENPELFLTQGASIASIAPGQVQIVRFSHLGAIPYQQAYHLEVAVEPVEGEIGLNDNVRAFDILIRQEQDNP
jgi:hypothetical protein